MTTEGDASNYDCIYETCTNMIAENNLYCESHKPGEVCIEENCSRKPETCHNIFYSPVYCSNHRRCYNRTCLVKVTPPDYFCEHHYPGNQEAHPNFDSLLNDWGSIILSDDSNDSTISHASASLFKDSCIPPISNETVQALIITPKRKEKTCLNNDETIQSPNITPKKKKKTSLIFDEMMQPPNITPKGKKKPILIEPIKKKHKEAKKTIKKIKKNLNVNVKTLPLVMSRKKNAVPIEPKLQWYKEVRKKHLNL